MVLGCLEILLEVLEGYMVSVVLKTNLLGLILFVLCFPKAVIHRLVRLLTLGGPLLLEDLQLLQSWLVYGSYISTVRTWMTSGWMILYILQWRFLCWLECLWVDDILEIVLQNLNLGFLCYCCQDTKGFFLLCSKLICYPNRQSKDHPQQRVNQCIRNMFFFFRSEVSFGHSQVPNLIYRPLVTPVLIGDLIGWF